MRPPLLGAPPATRVCVSVCVCVCAGAAPIGGGWSGGEGLRSGATAGRRGARGAPQEQAARAAMGRAAGRRLSRSTAAAVLGVREDATRGEVLAAWRAEARRHHPDANTAADTAAASERFTRLVLARDALLSGGAEATGQKPGVWGAWQRQSATYIDGAVARPQMLTMKNIRMYAGALLVLPLGAGAYFLSRNSRLPYSNPLYAKDVV